MVFSQGILVARPLSATHVMLLIGTHPGGFTALTAAAGPAFASQTDEPATELLSWKGGTLHRPSVVDFSELLLLVNSRSVLSDWDTSEHCICISVTDGVGHCPGTGSLTSRIPLQDEANSKDIHKLCNGPGVLLQVQEAGSLVQGTAMVASCASLNPILAS